MGNDQAQSERIEVLRALLDRLGSPDLTLGEANVLRCRLLDLTGRGEESKASRDPALPTAMPCVTCGGHHYGSRSPECRNFAA